MSTPRLYPRGLRLTTLACAFGFFSVASAGTLDIYDIDTEGGAAVLFVTPSGTSVLIDTGNAGTRDAERIAEAARAAHLEHLDFLIVTHYHGDHVGGFPELSKRLPIRQLVDHGATVQPEQATESKRAYDQQAAISGHLQVRAGDRLPLPEVNWTIVSSAGETLQGSLRSAAAGTPNPYCTDFAPKAITADLENAQSVGSVITYGKFRTIELGDLLWNLEGQLACPINRIGHVDVLLLTHHGMNLSNAPALVDALQPVVAVMNNGPQKGAAVETFRTLEALPGLEDLWQLHWSYNGALEYNAPGRFIANLENAADVAAYLSRPPEAPAPVQPPLGHADHEPAYWIKVSAELNGDFTVTNSRNGFAKRYRHRD